MRRLLTARSAPLARAARVLVALALPALAAGCASTGQVAPRTLTVEVSRDPASVLRVDIVIVPVRGDGSPGGDPVVLGSVRPRDLASFEFDTDRMGNYRLYATSGRVIVGTRIRVGGSGRDDAVSRIFHLDPDDERIIWDLATNVLLVR